jgi:protein dithiol oxidoreductase (disulfide-forming)
MSPMNRRVFALSGLSALALPSFAQAPAAGVPQEGRDYQRLSKQQPVETAGKPEVLEFFAYSCGHCYNFEPIIDRWLPTLPQGVVFKRVPIAFRDNLVPHQRMYYTVEGLGKLKDLHGKIFSAIHGQGRALATGPEQAEFMAQFGVDKDAYLKLYSSFGIQSKAQRATQMAQAYNVDSTPTVSVNGRFTAVGADEKTLRTASYLIAQSK